MTRKDYELIAENIRRRINNDIANNVVRAGHIEGIASTVAAVATALAQDNSRFDASRFIEACGIDHEVLMVKERS